ncbi:MAG: 2-oxoacid:acceptor oxidoreductase family protein, partial [Rhodospirillales bacterium]|nr:2-oxoacid:acceptor oxidoreductase family protein [Rhodospirillales bacterium]
SGSARLLLACDIVTAGSGEVMGKLGRGSSRAVVNTHISMTADFTRDPDRPFPRDALIQSITRACNGDPDTDGNAVAFADMTELATALLGDAIATNLFIVGFAHQKGWLPVSADAIERAIELNGVAVDLNRNAFRWGRRAAHDVEGTRRSAGLTVQRETDAERAESLDAIIARRVEELTAYQSARYARRYVALVNLVRETESARVPGTDGLAAAVAQGYFKLMAYKDEYEVARLFTDGRFTADLARDFEGDFKISFHLAPPLLARRDPATGHLKKREYGPWVMATFRRLAPLKVLRGTPLDVFGYTAERRRERGLIRSYEATVRELIAGLNRDNHELAREIASLPRKIRGFGHVKEQNIRQVEANQTALLEAFRRPHSRAHAAE